MKFKVGDRVYLKKESRWFGSGPNPDSEEAHGEVIRIEQTCSLPITVRWHTKDENWYEEHDLEFTRDYLQILQEEFGIQKTVSGYAFRHLNSEQNVYFTEASLVFNGYGGYWHTVPDTIDHLITCLLLLRRDMKEGKE